MNANRLKHPLSTHSQADRAMPLSEPMKAALVAAILAAILVAIVVAVATLVLASVVMAIANAIVDLTSTMKAEAIAGGIFEDRLDLD